MLNILWFSRVASCCWCGGGGGGGAAARGETSVHWAWLTHALSFLWKIKLIAVLWRFCMAVSSLTWIVTKITTAVNESIESTLFQYSTITVVNLTGVYLNKNCFYATLPSKPCDLRVRIAWRLYFGQALLRCMIVVRFAAFGEHFASCFLLLFLLKSRKNRSR